MRIIAAIIICCLELSLTFAGPKPKLAVVFVLDQFPYEYIDRCRPYLSAHGFRYLLERGANFPNTQYEHVWTKTAAGHAVISTGAYGHLNGIPANNWYDRKTGGIINAVGDSTVRLIPGDPGRAGRSPGYMKSFTIGDMLRLQTGNRSRVVAVANKDRAAVLLAGKSGTAFWIDHGKLTTSTYYTDSPAAPFLRIADSSIDYALPWFGHIWNELNPSAAAASCDKDDRPYEFDGLGLGRTFPHRITGIDTSTVTSSFYDAFDHSPFATEMLLNIARTFILSGNLGGRETTDLMFIGIGASDEIGHQYGPASHEAFDNVLRTDLLLEDFFSFLGKTLGLDNCLIALTSDHGIAPIPEYIRNIFPAVPSGRITAGGIGKSAAQVLENAYRNRGIRTEKWIARVIESEITLDRDKILSAGIQPASVTALLKDSLSALPFAAAVVTRDEILSGTATSYFGKMAERSFDPERSGDVMIILRPFYIMSGETTGTNHGQPYSYDAHVPMMFAGPGIRPGVYSGKAQPIDLAPTLASLLGCNFPPACEGRVLGEAKLEK